MKNKCLGQKVAGLMLFFLPLTLIPQTTPQPAPIQPIEVPVRVTSAGQPVDNLTLEDFEITEDGKPQRIDALYLVKGTNLTRTLGGTSFPVNLSRHYYLLFQTNEYDPKLADAVDYLFQNCLLPEDSMTLMTPMKPYNLAPDALKSKPKEKLSKDMQSLLKKDIQQGGGEYRDIIKDLKKLVKVISAGGRTAGESDMETDSTTSELGLEMTLDSYKTTLVKLENLRLVDGQKFLDFSRALRKLPGQKVVFLFYQREFRPEISSAVLNTMMSMYQDDPNVEGDLMELFQFYSRKPNFDVSRIRQALADASICFNLIFMNKESQYYFGTTMREQSEDLFRAFSDMAQATGGMVDNSPNPAAAFKKAADTLKTYYLLYYTPQESNRDGGFRNIKVTVKNKGYAVAHRLGYFMSDSLPKS